MSLQDIIQMDDIRLLVDRFYDKIRQDPDTAPVFEKAIGNHWPAHLEKMYRFWQTILLQEHTYSGTPFPPHQQLALGPKHFERWLQLFHQTLDELFTGQKAAEAKWRSAQMARLFMNKLGLEPPQTT